MSRESAIYVKNVDHKKLVNLIQAADNSSDPVKIGGYQIDIKRFEDREEGIKLIIFTPFDDLLPLRFTAIIKETIIYTPPKGLNTITMILNNNDVQYEVCHITEVPLLVAKAEKAAAEKMEELKKEFN